MIELPAKFNFPAWDINWTAVILTVTFLVLLPLQLWLCRKAKRTVIRLLPAIIFAASALILALTAYLVGSWEGLFILLLSLYTAFCAIICILSFFIHLAWGYIKQYKSSVSKRGHIEGSLR